MRHCTGNRLDFGAGYNSDMKTSFVNIVWRVQKGSTIPPGALYVFLSDGTLVITAAKNRPALGSWRIENGGKFVMVEDGRPYRVDIVEQSNNAFRIRINGPGRPVEITFAPAV